MTNWNVLLALAALAAIALFYISLGMREALAPFAAMGSAAVLITLFGCFGLLPVGAWAVYIFAAGAAVWLLVRHVVMAKPMAAPGFGFWFFLGGSLLLTLLLWLRQPTFTSWDEFSFWGTAAKLMTLYDEFYTTAPVGWGWVASQKPVLPVMSYFFQFFGAEFAPWQTYAAYDAFQLAAIGTLAAGFGKNRWNLALPLLTAGFFAPWVFTLYRMAPGVTAPYADTLADIPMGLCFGAVLCCWYGAAQKKPINLVAALLGLFCLTMMKETGFALALVAAVMMAADYLLNRGAEVPAPPQPPAAEEKKTLLGVVRGGAGAPAAGAKAGREAGQTMWYFKALRLVLLLAAPLAAFAGWAKYLGAAAGVAVTESVGGTRELGMFEMVFAFIRETFSSEKSELYRHVTAALPRAMLTGKVNMLGPVSVTVAAVLGMAALGYVLCKNTAMRKRLAWFGLLGTLGFVAYTLLIMMTYIYLFRFEQAMVLEGWERYIYPYLIGWFLAGLHLLAAACKPLQSKRAGIGRLAVLAVAAVFFIQTLRMVPLNQTIFGVHHDEYNERRAFGAYVREVREALDPQGKTFMVISDDGGLQYFIYCYEFLPWQLDYSYGGGELLNREKQPDGTVLQTVVTDRELAEHLVKTGCTTMFIDNADEVFKERYGGLFSDGMAAYESGATRYYTVEVIDAATVTLTPMFREG